MMICAKYAIELSRERDPQHILEQLAPALRPPARRRRARHVARPGKFRARGGVALRIGSAPENCDHLGRYGGTNGNFVLVA